MKTAELDAAFEKCVIKSKCIYGDRYRCVKRLWQVDGNDSGYVRGRAFYYFMQYYLDGEYDDLLNSTK
jgi:hypothetical protein